MVTFVVMLGEPVGAQVVEADEVQFRDDRVDFFNTSGEERQLIFSVARGQWSFIRREPKLD